MLEHNCTALCVAALHYFALNQVGFEVLSIILSEERLGGATKLTAIFVSLEDSLMISYLKDSLSPPIMEESETFPFQLYRWLFTCKIKRCVFENTSLKCFDLNLLSPSPLALETISLTMFGNSLQPLQLACLIRTT